MKKETKVQFIVDFLFYTFVIICICMLAFLLPLILPLAFAFVLALIYLRLSKSINGLKSKRAAIFSAVLFYLAVSLLLFLLLTRAFDAAAAFTEKLPSVLEENIYPALFLIKEEMIKKFPYYNSIFESMSFSLPSEFIKDISYRLVSFAGGLIKNIPLYLAATAATVISSFYIATDFDSLKAFYERTFPKEVKLFLKGTGDFFSFVILKIAKAYLLLMIMTFLLLLSGFYILGIKNALKKAVIIALLDVLPLLGTGCALIPWGIFNIVSKNISKGIGLIILYLVIAIVRNAEEPRLLGKELGLDPVISLFACYLGLKFLGLKGVIIFPVLLLYLKFIFKSPLEQ